MIIKLSAILLGSFLIISNINAQLCQGSLGDPIINVTFGQGANPGNPIAAAGTSYQYRTADCPGDGFYTIRNNTISCFGNTWHTLNADHTGDPGGYFMLVNASVQPGVFYLDTVRGLCGNTTYEFAAWVINVLLPSACGGSGNQPDLTFSIERTDGTLLQSFNTNNISSSASPAWKQYGSFFTTPPLVSDVVLRIVNNAPGGCGNDLALDDITFRPCGPQITETIDGQPVTTKRFCEGPLRSFVLNGLVSGGLINPAYQWQSRNSVNNTWTDIPMGNSNTLVKTFVQNTAADIYEYRLAVAASGNINSSQCRVYSQPFLFTIDPTPAIMITANSPVCENSTLTLSATGGTQYQWSGPNNFTSNLPTLQLAGARLNQSGKYYVTVTNAEGCTNKDSAAVIINPSPLVTTAFANTTICTGDSVQLIASGGTAYQWTPSKGLSGNNIPDPKASPAQTTQYNVIALNQFSCKDTAVVDVIVHPKPIANAGDDKIIFKGQSIRLSGNINTTGNYFWSPPVAIDNIHSLQPVVNPSSDMYYILNLVSNFGCGISNDSTLVKVYNGIFIPNAFSPNGDNVNDTWNISGLGACTNFEVSVYNRWGQLVFHAKDKIKPWDGTFKGMLSPVGAYTYYIKACNGVDAIKGMVLLIR
ncbi:MAG TPA: gliding motility-associated C-terminal domain-containing protein [Chitinophagaceae bacterium]|nr:gliding motility-associated C-terminal domain-containing protein [Chitinophagaceae bacterium]